MNNMKNTKHFTFLRHGRTVADDLQKYESRYDCEMTDEGHKQIAHLLSIWALDSKRTYDIIVTSPLKRARDTALLASNLYQAPIVENKLLLELDAGALCGMDKSEGILKYPPPEHSTPYTRIVLELAKAMPSYMLALS